MADAASSVFEIFFIKVYRRAGLNHMLFIFLPLESRAKFILLVVAVTYTDPEATVVVFFFNLQNS